MKNQITTDSIGLSMRRARLDAGLSIRELSVKSGVSENSISNHELGSYMPGLLNLVKLADALQLPVDDYIGRRIP